MGIFKAVGWLVTGGAVRPTTTRERSRMYQRRANNLLEEQLYATQDLGQQQRNQFSTDARPRGTCPACLELMLVGASTCPNCHTTGITWPEQTHNSSVTNRQSPGIKKHHCGGEVALLGGGHVYCKQCKSGLNPKEYPHLFRR